MRNPSLPIAWRPLLVLVASSLACSPPLEAQEFRTFQNKEGKEIALKVLDIDDTRRLLRGEMANGQAFTLEIVKLSLDDQQYLKEWLQAKEAEAPAAMAEELEGEEASLVGEVDVSQVDFDLVTIMADLNQVESSRADFQDGNYIYRGEKNVMNYELSVSSRGREPVPPLKLEYCILYNNPLWIRWDAKRDQDPVSHYTSYGPVAYLFGSIDLEAIPFNHTERHETRTFNLETMGLRRRDPQEETVFGILVRLTDESGNVFHEWQDLIGEAENLTWDFVKTKAASINRGLDYDNPKTETAGTFYLTPPVN